MTMLTDLAREVSGRDRCPLAQGRTKAVPGEGPGFRGDQQEIARILADLTKVEEAAPPPDQPQQLSLF